MTGWGEATDEPQKFSQKKTKETKPYATRRVAKLYAES
jgi:hypothetical protein